MCVIFLGISQNAREKEKHKSLPHTIGVGLNFIVVAHNFSHTNTITKNARTDQSELCVMIIIFVVSTNFVGRIDFSLRLHTCVVAYCVTISRKGNATARELALSGPKISFSAVFVRDVYMWTWNFILVNAKFVCVCAVGFLRKQHFATIVLCVACGWSGASVSLRTPIKKFKKIYDLWRKKTGTFCTVDKFTHKSHDRVQAPHCVFMSHQTRLILATCAPHAHVLWLLCRWACTTVRSHTYEYFKISAPTKSFFGLNKSTSKIIKIAKTNF